MNHFAHKNNGHSPVTAESSDLRPDAARARLGECHDQASACEVIREVVSNLLGCEEMALFQLDRKRGQLSLIWSFGVEPNKLHLGQHIGESALSGVLAGEPYIRESSANGVSGERASAIVPIHVQNETAGVLALLRFLPQKTRIDTLDRELLSVLSNEAGQPLFGAAVNSSARSDGTR
jgi:chemotaxis protein CheD